MQEKTIDLNRFYPEKYFSVNLKVCLVKTYFSHPLKQMEFFREITTLTKLKNEPLYYLLLVD